MTDKIRVKWDVFPDRLSVEIDKDILGDLTDGEIISLIEKSLMDAVLTLAEQQSNDNFPMLVS